MNAAPIALKIFSILATTRSTAPKAPPSPGGAEAATPETIEITPNSYKLAIVAILTAFANKN
jgi:hypothetical protein